MPNYPQDRYTTSVGGWGASLAWEFGLIAALICFILVERQAWRCHPVLTGAALVVFFTGLHPAFDEIARHSVWLHSLQSLMIHHLGPLLLVLASFDPCRPVPGSDSLFRSAPGLLLALLSFTAMTLLWLSPDLHVLIMESSVLYSVMKWGMVLSGILLCAVVMGTKGKSGSDNRWHFLVSLAITAPQIAAGLYLMARQPLYQMPTCISPVETWLPALDAVQDQRIGGALLIAASGVFFVGDLAKRLRTRTPLINIVRR